MTTIIEMHAVRENAGHPKKNGVVTPTGAADATPAKIGSPSAQATAVPATRPMSTDTVARKPENTRWMTMISASVPKA